MSEENNKLLQAVALSLEAHHGDMNDKNNELIESHLEKITEIFKEVMVDHMHGVNKEVNLLLGKIQQRQKALSMDTETQQIIKQMSDKLSQKTDKLIDAQMEVLELKLAELKSKRNN